MRLGVLLWLSCSAAAQVIRLEPATLKTFGVKVEKVESYKGRGAIRVTDISPDSVSDARLAILPEIEFGDGTIEVDMAGDLGSHPIPNARGFVGLAFRVRGDGSAFEAFYLRPLNGRAEDQLQRNHSVQYISSPEFPWERLRSETPGKYESYVDLQGGEWNHVKIVVQGEKARLFVNGAQPVLIVNDLKHGLTKGGLALWVGPSTMAHFANLRVMK